MDTKTREKIDEWQTHKEKESLIGEIDKFNISAKELLEFIIKGMQNHCSKNFIGCNDVDFGDELNEDGDVIREYLGYPKDGNKYPSCEEICDHHFCVKYNKLIMDTHYEIYTTLYDEHGNPKTDRLNTK